MAKPSLYVIGTNHGFGHTVRLATVIAQIQRLTPELPIIIATKAPRWLINSYVSGPFMLVEKGFDVGVIQSDALRLDQAATLKHLQELQTQAPQLIAAEVAFIKQNQVKLILADIPPMATAIAQAADIPCWMMGNFGWDFIYRAWGGEFAAIADWMAADYQQCDHLFRLPMAEPMSAFPKVTDVGLTGGTPRFDKKELRTKFPLSASKAKTVMLTFGGLGLQKIPYHNLQQFRDWQFITFDSSAPDYPNLLWVEDARLRPVDFMPLCDRIISKPGFSTFAEAMRLNTPIVTLERQDFAEAPYLLQALQDHYPHQLVSLEDFTQGDWCFLRQPLQPPRQNKPFATDGSQAIAEAIMQYFSSYSLG